MKHLLVVYHVLSTVLALRNKKLIWPFKVSLVTHFASVPPREQYRILSYIIFDSIHSIQSP